MKILWIALGGAFGSVARYLLEGWVQRTSGSAFPWGTLSANVLGSFLIAVLMTLLAARSALDSTLRLALVTGVLGGFTTYSSFNHQTLELLRGRDWMMGSLNVLATLGLCLLAGVLGLGAARWLMGPA